MVMGLGFFPARDLAQRSPNRHPLPSMSVSRACQKSLGVLRTVCMAFDFFWPAGGARIWPYLPQFLSKLVGTDIIRRGNQSRILQTRWLDDSCSTMRRNRPGWAWDEFEKGFGM